MVTSPFEYPPGGDLPSRDLVSWQLVGNGLDRDELLARGRPPTTGVTTAGLQNTPAGNATAHVKDLRGWVDALVDEYGLHAEIGPPDRWENIPPLRAELLGLKIADVRRLKLEQGSFELIYWHDALARIVDRASQHADWWQQDQQNQQLLGVAT